MVSPHGRPRPRITWWMRVRRFILTFESPLKLRGSIIRLRHRHKHPFLALLRLFLPLPTWHFPLPDPVPPKIMFNNLSLLKIRMAGLTSLRCIPVWRARDTPIRSLYRIYEAMVAGEFYAIGPEVEYFWYQARQPWTLHRIPDPHDTDPIRYAILACVAEELARAFNWRLSLGMRRDKSKHIRRKSFDEALPSFTPEVAPLWTNRVAAIDMKVIADLPKNARDSRGRLVLEPGGESPIFAERNIITDTGHFYTV